MSCCTDWPRDADPRLHDDRDRRSLEPGWGGALSDLELAYIQRSLQEYERLAYLWGLAPSQQTRPADAIRRLAMLGDPERRAANMKLARTRKGLKTPHQAPKMPVGRPNSGRKRAGARKQHTSVIDARSTDKPGANKLTPGAHADESQE